MTNAFMSGRRHGSALRASLRASLRAVLGAVFLVGASALLTGCTTTERPPADSTATGASGAASDRVSTPDAGTLPAPVAPASSAAWQVRPDAVEGSRDGDRVIARVGASAADARSALGIAPAAPFAGGSCAFIEPGALPVRLYFMAVSDTLVRIDVRDSSVTTTEGARIGDSEARIRELYGSTVRTEPHKYTGPTGHYLIVTPAGNATHRIVFETDGQRVTMFRAGRLPEVEWVEGCS